MAILKDELSAKLNHMLYDIKEMQMAIIRQKNKENKVTDIRLSAWQLLMTEMSNKWKGYSAVEEIRRQREK